jgi:hypothetical protein
MTEFLTIAWMIIEIVAFLAGLYAWAWKDNLLLGIILFCLAIYAKLTKNESIHKLEKQGKL